MRKFVILVGFGLAGWMASASGQVSTSPSPGNGAPHPAPPPVANSALSVTTSKRDPSHTSGAAAIDYINAKAVRLPAVAARSELQAQYDLMDALHAQAQGARKGGVSPGSQGTGRMRPLKLGAPLAAAASADAPVSLDFGSTNHPFTTARADLFGLINTDAYPYRATGKLFFLIDGDTFLCSASLIKPGVVVTAAHCVANFANQFYSNWSFVPAYSNGDAPFGIWPVASASVMTSYFNGSDSCSEYDHSGHGVVCSNDVALLLLKPDAAGAYPGAAAGWYGYGYDGWSFSASGLTQVTQLGYPVCLDGGAFMERNDSYGYTSAANSNNTIIGSLMCGGASGGPWLANFGLPSGLTDTIAGNAANSNVIVGVTSWGYNGALPKETGSTPFTGANIVQLLKAVCSATPAAC